MFLALHPTLDLKALTVCANGFATAHGGPANMQRVLSLIGREDVPVSVGVHEGLSPITNFPLQWRVEIDRFYEAQELPESSAALSVLDSPALIAKTLKESETAVAVLVTGSATNLAIALRKEPDLVGRISAIDAGADWRPLREGSAPRNWSNRCSISWAAITGEERTTCMTGR